MAQSQSKGGNASPDPPPPPESPKVNPTATDPNGTIGAGVDPNAYLIGPQDLLYIEVFGQPRFTRPVGVRPDGKITMPFVGDMQAAGLTPNKLRDQLKEALADQIINPVVDVSVTQVNSQKYTISGEVFRPDPIP